MSSRFSWVVEKLQATVAFRWGWAQGRFRGVGLFGTLHPHLLRFTMQRLVVAACCVSSMGINTTPVFVS